MVVAVMVPGSSKCCSSTQQNRRVIIVVNKALNILSCKCSNSGSGGCSRRHNLLRCYSANYYSR